VCELGFLKTVLFDDAVSCQDWVLYVASVTDGRMSMEHWWTDTDTGKADVHALQRNPFLCHFTPNYTWTGLELNLAPCCETEPWHGTVDWMELHSSGGGFLE